MKILVAEDNPVSRRMLEALLARWGHEAVTVSNGFDAWKAMAAHEGPPLFILDWMMPGQDGATLCRKFRESFPERPAYIILLTALSGRGSLLSGLDAGVDDYVTKPFHPGEFKARLDAGLRVVTLQQALAAKAEELAETLAAAVKLQELLPMCSYCKKVRDGRDYWRQVDSYLGAHTGAHIEPSVCPACFEKTFGAGLDPLPGQRPAPQFSAAPAAGRLHPAPRAGTE